MDGPRALDQTNLVVLCHPCHNDEHGSRGRKGQQSAVVCIKREDHVPSNVKAPKEALCKWDRM